MQEAITDGIGQSGITHSEVPVIQGILASDDSGTLVVAIFDMCISIRLDNLASKTERSQPSNR